MSRYTLFLLAAIVPFPAAAKPIVFGDGYVVMSEFGGGTMLEAQAFYAPRYWYSVGPGFLRLDAEDGGFSREITYLRANLLVRRWNLPEAQGNLFVWGGGGGARGSDFPGTEVAGHAGFQADYETLRAYSSLRSEWHTAGSFSHRIDTLQLGWAPYAHDWDRIATWLVAQGRHYTGGIYDGIEPAIVLRLFKGPVWVEGGATLDGEIQSMFMFNF